MIRRNKRSHQAFAQSQHGVTNTRSILSLFSVSGLGDWCFMRAVPSADLIPLYFLFVTVGSDSARLWCNSTYSFMCGEPLW